MSPGLRTCLLLALLLTAAAAPASARASFGLLPGAQGFDVTATAEGGMQTASRAGSHPYSLITAVRLATDGSGRTENDLRDLELELPPGLIENPTAVPRCRAEQFATPRSSPFEASLSGESCPETTQVGTVTLDSAFAGGQTRTFGVFNLVPSPGFPSRFGFSPYGIPISFTPRVREAGGEYGVNLELHNLSQQLNISGLRLVIWGVPWAISHNSQRGNCLNEAEPAFGWAKCPVSELNPSHPSEAYLTLPSECRQPLIYRATATSWQGSELSASSGQPPLQDCSTLTYNPVPEGRLSTDRASSSTGFDFTLAGSAQGLVNPAVRAPSQARRAVLTLAEGMTINPSVASGLGTCSEARFASETLSSPPGAGCPNDSKIGELTVDSPLLEEPLEGSMYFATPRENRFGTLLALYLIASSPQRGLLIKLAGKVTSDPATGRITTVFDDLPQLPYSRFDVHFREGQRSPLATPSACGTYQTEIETSPWLDPETSLRETSDFELRAGLGGGPCPPPLAPFSPAAAAGTLNSNASSYTPLHLLLTRSDADQEITSYAATLPPGLLARIAAVPYCPQAQIEAAGRQSGAESAARPACPPASQIGHTLAGYGLGSALAYAPGTLYLAGPYHGAPLSVVAIDSAKIGPFDLGTIVIRSAIHVDPGTAQVSIDPAGSDPIPHILAGFPLRLRDVRIYIDRPDFTLNPTSCDPLSLTSTLSGAAAHFSDPADDSTATVRSPFQLSNCSALDFAPRLTLALRGPHRRGAFPSLRANLRAHKGESNIARADVTLPPKLFFASQHLGTLCTAHQFAAHQCPPDSLYGHATARTPLLGVPLSGPVYLRSSTRELPDLLVALSGQGIEIDLLGTIDSYRGGLRARFHLLPDAPVSSFTLTLRGGSRGLIANATDTCRHPQLALARFAAHDNATETLSVPIHTACGRGRGPRR